MSVYACIGCGKPSATRRCARCRLRNGSTRTWRGTRALILERDGHLCRIPREDGSICGKVATHVDHIVPVIHGGTDEDSNLRAACAACNLSRGASA